MNSVSTTAVEVRWYTTATMPFSFSYKTTGTRTGKSNRKLLKAIKKA